MRRFRKILIWILIVVILLIAAGFIALKLLVSPEKEVKEGALKELTTEEKLEDFRYAYDVLKDSFPFFEIEKEKTGFDWLANKDNFEEKIKETQNNNEFYNTLNGIINMIQNGHTGVLSPTRYEGIVPGYKDISNHAWGQVLTQKGVQDKYRDWANLIDDTRIVLPIKLGYIEGKYVAVEDFEDVKRGWIINSIEDKPADIYFKENMDKYYLNYDDKRDKLYTKSNMIVAEEEKQYKITFITKDNKKLDKYFNPMEYIQDNSIQNANTSSEEKVLKEGKVGYIKVKSMSNRTLQSDGKKIIEFYKSIKDYPYLIIDIRGNGGGTDEYWKNNIVEPLISDSESSLVAMAYKGSYIKPFLRGRGITTKPIEKLPEQFSSKHALQMETFLTTSRTIKPKNTVGFKGAIYLLVDDRVYSSSESFAAFSKGAGFATLVGTTTGGDGIGIDPCVMALPNSGLVVRFSLDMGINSDGTINEKEHTKPDVFAEITYEDFIKGEDTVLNKVLQLCK